MIDFKTELADEAFRQYGEAAPDRKQLVKDTIQYLENEGLLNHEAIGSRYNLIPAGRDFEPAVDPVDYNKKSAAEVAADNAGLNKKAK